MKNWLLLILATVCCNCMSVNDPVTIIPQPNTIHLHDGSFDLYSGQRIVTSDSLIDLAHHLIDQMDKVGIKLVISKNSIGDLYLGCTKASENLEAYRINITGANIQLLGSTKQGVRNAISSLLQLGTFIAHKDINKNKLTFPRVEIIDQPRFSYRGLHLDVSRHFFDVDEIKQVLDYMFRYKLNKFHWHLTDDQGWRIEIKQYPLLTQIGGWRKLNNHDRQCQAYESMHDNPSFSLNSKHIKVENGDTLYGGYYTQDQIEEIVCYASERGIDIIPEIDMPGHLMAAISAYPYISCKNQAQWGASFSDPLCVGNKQALQLVKDVYTEIASMFPYKQMHLGADEVEKTNWETCAKCQLFVKENGLIGVDQLQSWFVHEMEQHFSKIGKQLIGWDEIIDGGLSETATVMWWRNWAKDAVSIATNAGNNVIITPSFQFYLDAWESENTLKDCYAYEPISEELTSVQANHILGVQGCLWAETVPTFSRLQHQYFPRILAIAEIGWTHKQNKNWNSFMSRYINEARNYLDQNGICYRIPNITGFYNTNSFVDTASVIPQCALPNIEIRYTTDLSTPNQYSDLYIHPIKINTSTIFKFRAFRPNKSAGDVYTTTYVKEQAANGCEDNPTRSGILCKYFVYEGQKCDKVSSGKFVNQYALDSISLPMNLKGWIGLTFNGYFEVFAKGIYTFKLTSDDGSVLQINDKILIDNDGPHGSRSIYAQVALDKGIHKIAVDYFDMNNGGFVDLQYKFPESSAFVTMKNFKY